MPSRGPAADEMGELIGTIQGIRRRLDKLEKPDGNQLGRALEKVQQLIADLPGLVTAFLAGGFTAASASITGALTVGGILRSPATYSNSITSSFRSVYTTSVDGSFGFNLSSRRFKQDIEPFAVDAAAVAQIRIVMFRYIAAVELEGDAAEHHVGLIAEELHELGFWWLVDYNEDGEPEGVKFDRLSVAVLGAWQSLEERVAALEATSET